jgi:hypothetical protein
MDGSGLSIVSQSASQREMIAATDRYLLERGVPVPALYRRKKKELYFVFSIFSLVAQGSPPCIAICHTICHTLVSFSGLAVTARYAVGLLGWLVGCWLVVGHTEYMHARCYYVRRKNARTTFFSPPLLRTV